MQKSLDLTSNPFLYKFLETISNNPAYLNNLIKLIYNERTYNSKTASRTISCRKKKPGDQASKPYNRRGQTFRRWRRFFDGNVPEGDVFGNSVPESDFFRGRAPVFFGKSVPKGDFFNESVPDGDFFDESVPESDFFDKSILEGAYFCQKCARGLLSWRKCTQE